MKFSLRFPKKRKMGLSLFFGYDVLLHISSCSFALALALAIEISYYY